VRVEVLVERGGYDEWKVGNRDERDYADDKRDYEDAEVPKAGIKGEQVFRSDQLFVL
jgi:hypothetical protein